jgi:tRNA pseudouridine38-40 synthase
MDRPTTRIRLDIAYDGSGFSGWARQPGLRTVQGELEAALALIFHRFGPSPTLVVAGRTDAGVHALGQVAHLDLTAEQLDSLSQHPAAAGDDRQGAPALANRLNGIVGRDRDLRVQRASFAPPGFDARFSALSRRYEYRIADAAAPRNPLERGRTLWYRRALDRGRMDEAAGALIGLHDWAAYCKPRDGATTIRTLHAFRWRRETDGVLVAQVTADAFCHGMVRSLVGASIAVGEGRLAPAELAELRDRGERTSRFKHAPAHALVLLEVSYPREAELGLRAVQTRARRLPTDPAAGNGSATV